MRKGIWIEGPSWTGWLVLVAGDKAVPITHDESEIEEVLARVRLDYPDAHLVEAREAPVEIEWSEAVWRRCVGLAK